MLLERLYNYNERKRTQARERVAVHIAEILTTTDMQVEPTDEVVQRLVPDNPRFKYRQQDAYAHAELYKSLRDEGPASSHDVGKRFVPEGKAPSEQYSKLYRLGRAGLVSYTDVPASGPGTHANRIYAAVEPPFEQPMPAAADEL